MLAVSLALLDSLLLAQASVTVMLASAIYLLLRWLRRRQPEAAEEAEGQAAPLLPVCVNQLLDIAFWGLLTASLFMLTQGVYARPLTFLIMASVMAAVLAVQIYSGGNSGLRIFKVMVIASARASAYYQFPGAAVMIPLPNWHSLMSCGLAAAWAVYGTYQFTPWRICLRRRHPCNWKGVADSFFMLE
jgi:hypothetical protein